ncbi:hypothetical protein [Parasitella parasitica]|uniref:Uncharacterized protein n=1 Tax=Parasitella parasitica TaxID=35722 RepID=A0A0B7NAZ2_9FUNG|nr:hypothetical protein [Parasitella parasitica]
MLDSSSPQGESSSYSQVTNRQQRVRKLPITINTSTSTLQTTSSGNKRKLAETPVTPSILNRLSGTLSGIQNELILKFGKSKHKLNCEHCTNIGCISITTIRHDSDSGSGNKRKLAETPVTPSILSRLSGTLSGIQNDLILKFGKSKHKLTCEHCTNVGCISITSIRHESDSYDEEETNNTPPFDFQCTICRRDQSTAHIHQALGLISNPGTPASLVSAQDIASSAMYMQLKDQIHCARVQSYWFLVDMMEDIPVTQPIPSDTLPTQQEDILLTDAQPTSSTPEIASQDSIDFFLVDAPAQSSSPDSAVINFLLESQARKPALSKIKYAPGQFRSHKPTAENLDLASKIFNSTQQPPTAEYKYLYFPSNKRMKPSVIRSRLTLLRIDNVRILDAHSPDWNVIGLLIHINYEAELLSKFAAAQVHPISYDYLDPVHLRDQRHSALPNSEKVTKLQSIFKNNLMRSLSFMRYPTCHSVAKFFHRQAILTTTELNTFLKNSKQHQIATVFPANSTTTAAPQQSLTLSPNFQAIVQSPPAASDNNMQS